MKKSPLLLAAALSIISFSCATTKLQPGEELVEFKWKSNSAFKKQITQKELREDCDMLNYILYTCYAGIDEAIESGLDLNAKTDEIYENMLKKKIVGSDLYDSKDFSMLVRETISKGMKLSDQHIGIDGSLKDSVTLYYSSVYLEKKSDSSYIVKKSETEKVQPGQVFTGIQSNLFECISDGTILYRYGVLTNKKISSANISIAGETFQIPVKADKPIYQKSAWNGLKETNDTLYMSLSDCFNLNGLTDNNTRTEEILEKDLLKIAKAAKNKKNIIYDLRSNTGGYKEFPAKMLAAAYYNQHDDVDFRKQIEALMLNNINENTLNLVSPFTMQNRQNIYKNFWKNQFARLSKENQKMYKDYWSSMQTRPIRKFIDAKDYQCELDDFPEPDFKGTVYVLLNSRTISAAELGTAMAFMLQDKGIDVKLVGENSCGGVKYVSLWDYYLPNSGIYLYIPAQVGLAPIFDQIPQFKGEGKGFYPDYWASSENLLDTLIYCTGDNELKTTLKGLDKEML